MYVHVRCVVVLDDDHYDNDDDDDDTGGDGHDGVQRDCRCDSDNFFSWFSLEFCLSRLLYELYLKGRPWQWILSLKSLHTERIHDWVFTLSFEISTISIYLGTR